MNSTACASIARATKFATSPGPPPLAAIISSLAFFRSSAARPSGSSPRCGSPAAREGSGTRPRASSLKARLRRHRRAFTRAGRHSLRRSRRPPRLRPSHSAKCERRARRPTGSRHSRISRACEKRSSRSRPRPRRAHATDHPKTPQPRRLAHRFCRDRHDSRCNRIRHAPDFAPPGPLLAAIGTTRFKRTQPPPLRIRKTTCTATPPL